MTEKKPRTYVNRVLVKQLENEVQCALGENFGIRKGIEAMNTLIAKNKRRIKKIQDRIKDEKKGTLRGTPIELKNDNSNK